MLSTTSGKGGDGLEPKGDEDPFLESGELSHAMPGRRFGADHVKLDQRIAAIVEQWRQEFVSRIKE